MTVDVDRLREEAEVADGFGTAEEVDPEDWAAELRVGDVLRIERLDAGSAYEQFTAPVIGFSKDKRWKGHPLIRAANVPAETNLPFVTVMQSEAVEVVSGDD